MTKQKPAAKKTGYVVEERTSQGWVKHNVVYQTKKEAQEFIGTDHGKMRVVKHVQKKNKSVYPVEEKRIDKKGKPGNPEDDVVDYTQQVRRRPFKKGGEAGYVRVGESEKKGYIVKVTAVGKGLPPRAAGKQKGEKKPKPAAKPPSVKSVSPAIVKLAIVGDQALDEKYHYGLSEPGSETFGWVTNVASAKAASKLIKGGVTSVEKISAAVHESWGKVAKTFDDPVYKEKPEKKERRLKLASTKYKDLAEDEQEKNRVMARAYLKELGITPREKKATAEKKPKPTKQPKAEPAPGKAPRITYGEFKGGYLDREQQEMVEKRLAKLDANKLRGLLAGLATKRGWITRFKQNLNIDLGEKKEKPVKADKPVTEKAEPVKQGDDLSETMAYITSLGEEVNEAPKKNPHGLTTAQLDLNPAQLRARGIGADDYQEAGEACMQFLEATMGTGGRRGANFGLCTRILDQQREGEKFSDTLRRLRRG